MEKKSENPKRKFFGSLVLSLLSVFLFWIMMLLNWWFFIWFSFAPLFLAIKREKIIFSLIFMEIFVVLLNFTSFSWFMCYSLSAFFICMGLMGLFSFFYIILIKKLSLNKISSILISPLTWIVLVILFSFNPLGSTWANFGFYWPMMAPLISYIKGIGVTFLIILSNSLIAHYFYHKDKKILIGLLILFLIVISCFIFSYYGKVEGKEIKVAIIQGNINRDWTWRLDNMEYILSRYENLTMQTKSEKPEIIIWPEYAIPIDITFNRTIYERISNLSKNLNSYIILGTITTISKNPKIIFQKEFNTLLVFSPQGEVIARYDSIMPAPFNKDIVKGKYPYANNLIKISNASAIVGLCFEELKPQIFNKESDFIILLVNNQRFDNTFGIELISLFSRLIAAENKKFAIRSSNTGVTQIVDPYGKIVGKIEPYSEGILIGKIYI